MDEREIEPLAAWIVGRGLAGAGETELLQGFCERANAAGLPVASAVAIVDTLHPTWEGRAFFWRNDGVEEEAMIEYGSTREGGDSAANWKNTAFYHMLESGTGEVRRRIGFGEPADFYRLAELHVEGHTDYVALLHRFEKQAVIGEMDAVYSHWTTRHPEGFSEADCVALRRLAGPLALALKCASFSRITETLVDVYLGRDAGRRVLEGRINRGTAEKIHAVLWFSDLQSYTTLADEIDPGEVIPLLNDYAELVISAVHRAGGDVLKLIGDGVLAIFRGDDAPAAALAASREMRRGNAELNARRAADGRATTAVRLGLHVGEVFYGNIGSDERLDFTVVGPAVNEVSRIVSMCRSVDRDFLASSEFVAASPEEERKKFASVGRFALRGVSRAEDLFTLLEEEKGRGPAA